MHGVRACPSLLAALIRARALTVRGPIESVRIVIILILRINCSFGALTYPKTHQTWNIGHIWQLGVGVTMGLNSVPYWKSLRHACT